MLSHKNTKYFLYKVSNWIESMDAEKILMSYTSKFKDETGLQKIEEKDKHFLIENTIAEIEKKSLFIIEKEKKLENMLEIENNYRICGCVYQSLFFEIAETFIESTKILPPDEIKQWDENLKANGWRIKSMVEIEDSIKLLTLF